VRNDRIGNIIITVPASTGFEMAPVTVLQGHLDMVCEKNSNVEHDFDRDPIRLGLDVDPEG
jgi:dipeptidase D